MNDSLAEVPDDVRIEKTGTADLKLAGSCITDGETLTFKGPISNTVWQIAVGLLVLQLPICPAVVMANAGPAEAVRRRQSAAEPNGLQEIDIRHETLRGCDPLLSNVSAISSRIEIFDAVDQLE